MLETIVELEHETIRRQRKERRADKAKEKHLCELLTEKPENWDEVLAQWRSGEITVSEARKQLGMKKTVFYKMLKKSYDE